MLLCNVTLLLGVLYQFQFDQSEAISSNFLFPIRRYVSSYLPMWYLSLHIFPCGTSIRLFLALCYLRLTLSYLVSYPEIAQRQHMLWEAKHQQLMKAFKDGVSRTVLPVPACGEGGGRRTSRAVLLGAGGPTSRTVSVGTTLTDSVAKDYNFCTVDCRVSTDFALCLVFLRCWCY